MRGGVRRGQTLRRVWEGTGTSRRPRAKGPNQRTDCRDLSFDSKPSRLSFPHLLDLANDEFSQALREDMPGRKCEANIGRWAKSVIAAKGSVPIIIRPSSLTAVIDYLLPSRRETIGKHLQPLSLLYHC